MGGGDWVGVSDGGGGHLKKEHAAPQKAEVLHENLKKNPDPQLYQTFRPIRKFSALFYSYSNLS